MITSFWNLCRACPSMPVEKLHSEYRSTFQWHEYVGSHSNSVTQPPVVRQPSQAQQDHLSILTGRPEEPSFQRRKKHPELANRSSNGWLTKSSTTYEASLYPESRFTSISGASATGGVGTRGASGNISTSGGPRKSISLGTIQSAGNIAALHSPKLSLKPEDSQAALGAIAAVGTTRDTTDNAPPPVVNTVAFEGMTDSKGTGDEAGGSTSAYGGFMLSQSTELKIHVAREQEQPQGQRPAEDFKKNEYKSEYKKRFRPFSQYEYIDGKFFKKKGDHEIGGDPWYKEVIELRKKAGEYKFRGWGTELGPQHIAEAYHQHVWDQVSRRTSLAALALITTTPKSISKEEKDKENAKKSYPGRPTHARPHTATPKHPISDLEKSKHPDAVQKKKWDESRLQNRSTSRVKARSHSAGPAGRSPRKAIRQQSAASSVSEKDNSLGGWKVHLDSVQGDKASKPQQQRHPRPTTLATSPRPKASSGKGDRDPKLAKQQQFDKNSADPYLGYNEPVVKSPPEPTRVKSPEQVILRSPDPVNWTVPLDTTKSFTVTQNIREAPPSPRFRAGEKLHGELRNIHHPTSTHHSSAGSTMASSPISTFSTRSAPVPLSSTSTATTVTTAGQSGVPAKPDITGSSLPSTTTTTTTTTSTTKTSTTSAPQTTTSSTTTGKPTQSILLQKQEKSSGVVDQNVGSIGGGGGGGKPESSGAGARTGDGSSSSASATTTTTTTASSKPSQTSKLENKVSSSRSNSTSRTVNGFDEKPTPTNNKSLHKDKPIVSSPPVKSSPQLHRTGVKSARPLSTPAAVTEKPKGASATVGTHEQSKSKPISSTLGMKCLDDPTFMFEPPSKPSVTSSKIDPTKSVMGTKGATQDSKTSKPVTEQPKPTSKLDQSKGTPVGSKSEAKSSTTKSSTEAAKLGVKPSESSKSSVKTLDVAKSGSKLPDKGKLTEPVKQVTRSDVKSSAIHSAAKQTTESPKSKEPSKPSSGFQQSKISELALKAAAAKTAGDVPKTTTSSIIDSNKIASVAAASKPVDSNKSISGIPSKLPEPPKQISSDISKSTDPFKFNSSSPAAAKTLDALKPTPAPTTVTVSSSPKSAMSAIKDIKYGMSESSKIPELTKYSVAESSKIPEMTKSMMAVSASTQDTPKVISSSGNGSRIPEPVKMASTDSSRTPEMMKSFMAESSKIPEMTKSTMSVSAKIPEKVKSGGESKIPEMTTSVIGGSRIPEMSKSTVGESKISDMTKSIIGESRIPADMTKSIIGETKIPDTTRSAVGESKIKDVTKSTIGDSKVPEMSRSIYVDSSKISDMTKSTMSESKMPEMSGSLYGGTSRIPQMKPSGYTESPKTPDFKNSSLPESNKIPEMTKSMLAESNKMSEPSKHKPAVDPVSKSSDLSRSVYSESSSSSKIPEPMKSTFDSSKIPEPMKPTFDFSRVSEPAKLYATEASKLPESSRPSGVHPPTKIPEPFKSSTTAPTQPPPVPARITEPLKSGLPGPMSKIPEPMKMSSSSSSGLPSSSPLLPSKIPSYPGMTTASPIPGRTDTSVMSSSVSSGLHSSSTGFRLPPAPTTERPTSAKGSLRVLEAPSSPTSATAPGDSSSLKRKDFGFVPPAPVSIPKRTVGGVSHVSETPPQAKGSGYRVLEAPDDPNEPSVSIISPSSSRSRASDVLEKARHRFDKFWGKGKDDEK